MQFYLFIYLTLKIFCLVSQKEKQNNSWTEKAMGIFNSNTWNLWKSI